MMEIINSTLEKSEIEFLPPKPRYVCEECKKRYSKKLVKNKITNQMLCRVCNRRIGNNKFFSFKYQNPGYVGKYSMSSEEKQILGSTRSKQVSKWFSTLKKKKSYEKAPIKEIKGVVPINVGNKNRDSKKTLLEGLKQS